MDINALKWFRTIYETSNFRAAARKLDVAPSTLSRYLNHLEKELGCVLIDRTFQKFELTVAGRIFWEYTTQVLNIENQMYRALSRKASGETLLRIGAGTKTFKYFSLVYPSLLEKFPLLHLDCREGSAKTLLPLLYSKQVDIIIAAIDQLISSRVKIAPLFVNEVLLAVPAFHPTAHFGGTELNAIPPMTPTLLQTLRGTPFLMHSEYSAMYNVIRSFFSQYSFKPLNELSVSNASILEVLSSTGQYAYFTLKEMLPTPSSVPSVTYFKLPDHNYIYTAAIFRPDYEPTPVERELIRLLSQEKPPEVGGQPFINLVTKSIMQA